MNTKHVTREDFLALLGSAISDKDMRAQLIQAAKALIPGEAALAKLEALKSRQVQIAIKAYRELHPDCERGEPSIQELIRWLLEDGSVNRAQDFENRLKKIHTLLMNSGMIDQETPIVISFIDMLYIRYLSNIEQ